MRAHGGQFFIVPLSPERMARWFAAPENYSPDYQREESPECERTVWLELEPYLDMIPALEADILTLLYKLEKNERDVGWIFGFTQAACSYRVKRAKERIRFIRDLPKISDEELRMVLREALKLGQDQDPEVGVEILMTYLKSCSQTLACKTWGCKYERMVSVFSRAVNSLRVMNEGYAVNSLLSPAALQYLTQVKNSPAMRTIPLTESERKKRGPRKKVGRVEMQELGLQIVQNNPDVESGAPNELSLVLGERRVGSCEGIVPTG